MENRRFNPVDCISIYCIVDMYGRMGNHVPKELLGASNSHFPLGFDVNGYFLLFEPPESVNNILHIHMAYDMVECNGVW